MKNGPTRHVTITVTGFSILPMQFWLEFEMPDLGPLSFNPLCRSNREVSYIVGNLFSKHVHLSKRSYIIAQTERICIVFVAKLLTDNPEFVILILLENDNKRIKYMTNFDKLLLEMSD